ncbi:acetyl-CoA C-acyltransferase, partial [Actinomadura adrarensis]
MPEAVIVAMARSPIGRAHKGSLKDMRADDLLVQMVDAALRQVPGLDPASIDDIMVGCAQPAGEQGYNLARHVAIGIGLDGVPGTVVQRYCASSVQTTRMALHAIKAGEGHTFISAGVECVSRYGLGKSDGMEGTHNPRYAPAEARTSARSGAGA